jgi:hypothetical protein
MVAIKNVVLHYFLIQAKPTFTKGETLSLPLLNGNLGDFLNLIQSDVDVSLTMWFSIMK